MGKVWLDHKNYREMSEPFEDSDKANDALSAFFQDVKAARQKHHITDALVIAGLNVKYGDSEGSAMAFIQLGDTLKSESLAAYALGRVQAEQRELVNRLIAGKGK